MVFKDHIKAKNWHWTAAYLGSSRSAYCETCGFAAELKHRKANFELEGKSTITSAELIFFKYKNTNSPTSIEDFTNCTIVT